VPGGVLQDQITAGMMFAASIIWAGALAPIDVTVGAWPKLLDAAAYGRIRDLIAAPPTSQGKLPLPAPVGRLSVENALFAVPGQDKASPARFQRLALRLGAGRQSSSAVSAAWSDNARTWRSWNCSVLSFATDKCAERRSR
jgi:ABC-type protease/lipase transport system fused ATPase/permease subunit